MNDLCEVIITAPDEDWTVAFTRRLIEKRLAACGHHSTIRSLYTWDGAIHDNPETRVALHTRLALVEAIIAETLAAHPYEVPCVVAVPLTAANPAYADWIRSATLNPVPSPAPA